MTSLESQSHPIGLRHIKRRLQRHKRWGGRDDADNHHYPSALRRIGENVWQHTVSTHALSRELLKRYCLNSIRPRVVGAMLGIHEFGEINGDIPVEAQLRGMRKPDELEIVKKLVSKYKLPSSYIALFECFEKWESTSVLSRESAFARFIDTYEGTRVYLQNTFMSPDVSDDYKKANFDKEIELTKQRIFLPLLRLATLYKATSDRTECSCFCLMVFNVVDDICALFGEYKDQAKTLLEGDKKIIMHTAYFRK